ncbi:MAG: SMI1/KNR4 family protein [Bradymonadia bacterium]
MTTFEGFELADFWSPEDWTRSDYTEAAPTEETVQRLERLLGYRLPAAYVALARSQNGGMPKRRRHATGSRTSWAQDHIAIEGIFAIGDTEMYSLGGSSGSHFWIEEWNYPPLGIYFASCPSAGHDMLALDYRECGPDGEPQVVHVDQDFNFKVTFVAESFEAFIRGLQPSEVFDPDE